MPEPAPTSFDAAIASAFRQELVDYPSEVAPAAASDEQGEKAEKAGKTPKKPATKFRTAEPDAATRPVRAGGPVVELEASLVRELEPIEPAAADVDVEPAPAAEPEEGRAQPWRRTAMAELTALADRLRRPHPPPPPLAPPTHTRCPVGNRKRGNRSLG